MNCTQNNNLNSIKNCKLENKKSYDEFIETKNFNTLTSDNEENSKEYKCNIKLIKNQKLFEKVIYIFFFNLD